MNDRNEEPFSRYTENKQLLNSIFQKEKVEKYSNQVIDQYYKSILRAHKRIDYTREYLDTGIIQDVVSDYLKDMQWSVKQDSVYSDFDSNFRFDLIARKEKRTILVLAYTDITRKTIVEIQKYIANNKKELPSTRIIIATDILESYFIIQKSQEAIEFVDMIKKNRISLIFTEKNPEYQETWLVPSEFL